MRVPTLHTTQSAFGAVEARQSEQARLQTQLSTGLRVRTPGDDPVSAAQSEMARSRMSRIASEQRSAQFAGSLLATADGALSRGVNVLQSVRETLVAAGNGGYSEIERLALAQQLRSAREEMLGLANASDGAGGFIFGGQGSSAAPVAGNSSPVFTAAAGEQRVSGQHASSVDGRAAFMSLPQGNGVFVTGSDPANTGGGWIGAGAVSDATQLTGNDYRVTVSGVPGALQYTVDDLTAGTTLVPPTAFIPGQAIDFAGQRMVIQGTPAAGDRFSVTPAQQQSVFATLDQAIALLESNTVSKPAYAEGLERVQVTLDGALDSLVLLRSRVGEELRRVDDGNAHRELESIRATELRSNLRDVDYAKAISEFQTNQASLDAALKTYTNIARTSLFELLR